ncbi:MAG: hypothetical protein DI623_00540 [Sphingomonas sanxanigenens]|uniref:LSU ribosomal protein L21p n=1 Tax=Sphingomonas sanxanigenens TaxID=397260 RepID=A0A2W5AG94_9SPHN|nr:MAG: hypothetical protein DI623_00540 [Sphingomonas sanxanigenens]
MSNYWTIIPLILLVILVGLWWLLKSRAEHGDLPGQSDAERATLPPAAAAPIKAPPAPPIVEPTVVEPEPEALVEPAILVATPAPEPAAKPAPAGEPDDLLLLKGVGPKLATLLGTLGVTRFAEIAAWTDADVARIDAELGNFKGRPVRDKWIEQAGYLAKGDRAGFEAKFGKIDG